MHNYIIKRSERKTLSLEVTKNLEVLVRAPLNVSEQDINSFVKKHDSWIERSKEKIRKRLEYLKEPDEAEIQRLKKSALDYIPEAVSYYSSIMGVLPVSVKITSAKTRFGSCSSKNGICFSWRLMQYPEAAIDYVVVHELAHIVHKNHGKLFYKCIEDVLPDYKERKKLLRMPQQ